MQGKPRSLRLPHALDECLEKRLQQLEIDSLSAYIVSLICYDLSIAKPHHTTGALHKLPPAERDKIFAEVNRAFRAGESLGGSWFEHLIAKASEEAGLPEPPSKVAAKLRERLAKQKK